MATVAALEPACTQSAYSVASSGLPSSAVVVSAPCSHLNVSVSRSSLPASFLSVNRDRPAALHPLGTCPQPPPPSQVLVVHGSPSSAHGLPAASSWHADEQQSPSLALPSSQPSPGSSAPLPHRRSAVLVPETSRQKQHMPPNEQACCSAANVPLKVS